MIVPNVVPPVAPYASFMIRLQFLGGGKMAEALIGGLLDSQWATVDEIAVVERYPERTEQLRKRFEGLHVGDAPHANVATVIAVKPQDIDGAMHSLMGLAPGRVLSIAAGISTRQLAAGLDDSTAVVRCMPNTPALVGAGASAVAAGPGATNDDVAWASSILDAVGLVITVAEDDIDAVTGLSGSGPGYVFLFVEALAAAGEQAGLSPEHAQALARQTVAGSGKLLAESPLDPATLRTNVTSPGGTTQAGLQSLTDNGFGQLIADAVQAATERSRELGQQ